MRQTGTQGNLNTGLVGRTQISLPSLDEQQGIVEVLSCVDIAIQKTDEVIVKTERLKKGLMQKLLTEGIGHKEFKDTPIGIVPTVWEIVRLGDVATELGSGLTPLGGSRTYLEHGIPLIRSQNVQMNRLDFADIAYISQETHRAMKRSTVFHGDLLLNITGASIGRVAVVPESIDEANVNQHVCRIRFSERMDSTFASFYLSSPKGQQQILSSQAGATRQGLNYQQAKLIQLPCPSLNEQREIVRILSTIVGKLELEQKDRRKIERIKQGLMDMLLTGKVRVRVD
jgi:type I restriction enzyme S subunit